MTKSAADWLRELYDAGALVFNPDGTASLNGEARTVVRALHAVLAGGEVTVEVRETGSRLFDRLERSFSDAVRDTNIANQYRAGDAPIVMMP